MTETPTHTPLPCPMCGRRPCVDNERGIWRIFCTSSKHEVSSDYFHTEAEALTAWNTRADSHHRLVEALEPFAFVGEDYPNDTQAVWEMIYRDRVHDWFSYEDFERARALLAALKEAKNG